MPGPRYENWHHLRIEGDRDAANALRPLARKVMGFVHEQAGINKLQTYKHTLELEGGGLIVAELNGGIPRVFIRSGSKKPGREIRVLEGFYFVRDTDTDEIHRPVMLVAPDPEDEESDWRVLFYARGEAGFEIAPEDRRGSYADVFGAKAEKHERLDPAGGIWVHRTTEEAVTWFRGYLGYWPMHYRHPVTNYSSYVCIYGHRVYEVPFPEWRVLAAAKRGQWLYVMVCENLGALDPPERPAMAEESGQVWCSQPYTDAAYTYSLWRYPLAIVTQPDTMIDAYKAGRHEFAEMLWQGDLSCAYGAWSFNADCTEVVTIQLPRIAAWYLHVVLDAPSFRWEPSTVTHDDYPVSEVKRIAVNITHGEEVTAVKVEELAPTTIAEEDGVKLELVLAERIGDVTHPNITKYSRMEFQCGAFAIPALINDAIGVTYPSQTSRVLVHAHLPSMTFLFLRRTLGGGATISESVDLRYELFIGGEEVEIEDDPFAVSTTITGTNPVLFDEAHSRLVVPYFGVLDAGYEWYFQQELDAMTFLLGLSFFRSAAAGSLPIDGPETQFLFFPTQPYIPFTSRLGASPLPATLSGAIPPHAGAGGWSVAQYGGPGPFPWDDGNEEAPAVYFNAGEYLDPMPSGLPFFTAFGGASQFDGEAVLAVKIDPWGQSSVFEDDNPYPFSGNDAGFYPLRYATNGDVRPLIDALDENRLADWESMYYGAYPVGHTGKPMKRQQTRFEQ